MYPLVEMPLGSGRATHPSGSSITGYITLEDMHHATYCWYHITSGDYHCCGIHTSADTVARPSLEGILLLLVKIFDKGHKKHTEQVLSKTNQLVPQILLSTCMLSDGSYLIQ